MRDGDDGCAQLLSPLTEQLALQRLVTGPSCTVMPQLPHSWEAGGREQEGDDIFFFN